MVDISSQNNKINVTVSSSGNTANTNVTPDYARYYSEKSKEWAISNRIVDNIDYSSKYYANESKKQAVLATEQATIATNKTSEVVASGNTALSNIDTAKNNAITSITNQETTSKNVLINEGATQIGLIQNEGATQVANVQSTGFYMRDDKLYYINSQGEETEFKSGGSGLEICDIGMALYVDETKGLRRYLNGQIVDINTNTQAFLNRLQEITTLHPSLLCTEEEWQTAKTMSAFGQVGKFVFNYSGADIVSVRLPRVVNVQGLFDLQNLGMTVSAGLPNIEGKFGATGTGGTSDTSGSFSKTQVAGRVASANYGYEQTISFDASRSNPIYGNSDTVQQEAIQYPYFIQIATGSETEANIVNTLENVNGFTLLESKYSDKPLYNESWLLSNGQYNLKATYSTAYEGLQVEYNTEIEAGTTVTLPSGVSYTKRGLSVKLSTETYTDYDFVLNTANEKFRLPLKTNLASGKVVVGNGMTLGFTNGSTNFALTSSSATPYQVQGFENIYGTNVGTNATGNSLATKVGYGITTDPTKSGIELSDSNLYLYYYVGDIDQNHGIVNMGRIGEQLATKTDMLQASGAGMPSNRYIDLTLGASGSTYTAPANGYFYYYVTSKGANQGCYFNLPNGTGVVGVNSGSYSSTFTMYSPLIPVRKGDSIDILSKNTSGSFQGMSFIYAEGSK